MVREHIGRVHVELARLYNMNTQVWQFSLGHQVMVLVPTSDYKFLVKWLMPYGWDKVRQAGCDLAKQLYHVNLLKRRHNLDQALDPVFVVTFTPQTLPEVPLWTPLAVPGTTPN